MTAAAVMAAEVKMAEVTVTAVAEVEMGEAVETVAAEVETGEAVERAAAEMAEVAVAPTTVFLTLACVNADGRFSLAL